MKEPEWIKTEEINLEVAKRLREIRRAKKISQERLWYLSGVALGSIKRFERTGNISFAHLTKIAFVLGELEAIESVFKK